MAPRAIFKVQERGETDLSDLARALASRGYVRIEPCAAMPKPGQFFIATVGNTHPVRVLTCCERKEDRS